MIYRTFLFALIILAGVTILDSTSQAVSLDNPTTTSSGLQYQEIVPGTGETPKKGQRVFVHYTGTLENGTKFDSSRDRGQPLDFVLGTGQVIAGWDEGISTMKKGGKRLLRIPANLAYGSRAVGGVIPANSVLIFDVELVDIK